MKEQEFIDFWEKNVHQNSILKLISFENKIIIVRIMYKGEFSKSFGPDIQNVKICINKIFYTGDIEFHKESNDWFRHKHHLDKRYDNVILHIVYKNNSRIRIVNSKNKRLKTFIFNDLSIKEKPSVIQEKERLPCYYMFNRKINSILKIHEIFIRLGINNLNKKIKYILDFASYYYSSRISDTDLFNQLLFISIFKGLGYYHNRINFQEKIKPVCFTRNPAFLKDYLLMNDFKNYGRPNNSPHRRITQFLNFNKNCGQNFLKEIYSVFLFSTDFNDFIDKIMFLFNKNIKKDCRISKFRVMAITYNLIIPVLYIYLKYFHRNKEIKKIIKFLLNAEKFENNIILKRMGETLHKDKKIKAYKEIDIQGYYYLYFSYCKIKNCEKCLLYNELK